MVNQIAALADMPERLPLVECSRDLRDDFLLALCEVGAADRLVPGDKDNLLALHRHGAAAIVTAAAFATEFGFSSVRSDRHRSRAAITQIASFARRTL